jgi:transcriptional regulator with XRE-family HTH domain
MVAMSARLANAFRRNVRERMQQLELSQDELADRLKCGKSFVSQMLNGHRRPGLESLETFAIALGLAEPADLLREKKLAKSA